MIRQVTLGCVLCVLVAGPPARLFAQFNPYGNGINPYAPAADSGADPRVRRAYRERAVSRVGPSARDFVETQGDEAVAAIFACSRPVAVKLVEFYSSGELGKLSRPRDLLGVIAQPRHGDEVAIYAIHHAGELADRDSFDAYLLDPLEYALGLKQLAAGAAEARARRLNLAAMTNRGASLSLSLSRDEKLMILAGVGLVAIAGLLLWRRRRSQVC